MCWKSVAKTALKVGAGLVSKKKKKSSSSETEDGGMVLDTSPTAAAGGGVSLLSKQQNEKVTKARTSLSSGLMPKPQKSEEPLNPAYRYAKDWADIFDDYRNY